jgi:Fe-S-cluster containining protein
LKPINEIAIRVAGHEPYVFEMKKTKQGKCIFLEGDECRIYVLRPLVCRFYPFELKTPEGGVHEFGYTEECKGIGVGKRVGKAFFEELFRLVNSRLQEDQSLCR